MEQIKLDTPLITASKIEIDEVETPELATAVNALRDYALNTVLLYDVEIREAFRSSNRANFDNEVKRAINNAVTGFSRGELTSELAEKEDFSALYAEMFTDHEFADNLYSEISDILYAEYTGRVERQEHIPQHQTLDADTAVGMVNAGFPVFVVDIGEQLTRDMLSGKRGDMFRNVEEHTFAAPGRETEQYIALENLCEKLDSLNDEVIADYGASIRYYAVDEFHADSKFRWSDMRSEWENIRDALLKGETKFIHDFLNDHEDAELIEQLTRYEMTYLKGKNDRAQNNMVEHIPQQQDISHKTNNSAELTAAEKSANGQKRSIIMSNNTKLSVSSMTILGEDSSVKAYATVTINDEFAIKNVKVFEGKNGPFVSMPSRKIGGEYQDVVFPITKEAREQFSAAVIDCYNEMQKNGEEHFMSENTPPEKAISTITASVHLNDNDSKVKATGQIVIDDSFVVSGVCVIEGKDNLFASMPSYTNDIDERKDFAFPITKECYEKVQGAVLNDFNYIQSYHEMGGKENLTTAYDLHPKFADRLSAELNKNGITNIVKVKDGTANISVKIDDKERFAEIRKELAQSLKQEKEARDGGKKSLSERIDKAREQQSEKNSEQPKQPQPHRKPNQAEL